MLSDRYETQASGQGFLIGLLCGAAIGATMGLLFAPRSGAAMRKSLLDSADRFRHKAGETYAGASEAVSHLVDKGRTAMRRGREKLDNPIDEARAAASETTPSGGY
jgi:gas vesicle protein